MDYEIIRSQPESLTAQEIEMLAQKALQVLPKKVEYYAAKIGVTYGTTPRDFGMKWEGLCRIMRRGGSI